MHNKWYLPTGWGRAAKSDSSGVVSEVKCGADTPYVTHAFSWGGEPVWVGLGLVPWLSVLKGSHRGHVPGVLCSEV